MFKWHRFLQLLAQLYNVWMNSKLWWTRLSEFIWRIILKVILPEICFLLNHFIISLRIYLVLHFLQGKPIGIEICSYLWCMLQSFFLSSLFWGLLSVKWCMNYNFFCICSMLLVLLPFCFCFCKRGCLELFEYLTIPQILPFCWIF